MSHSKKKRLNEVNIGISDHLLWYITIFVHKQFRGYMRMLGVVHKQVEGYLTWCAHCRVDLSGGYELGSWKLCKWSWCLCGDPGGYIKFLEVMVLLQLVIQPLVGIELLWQLKKDKFSKQCLGLWNVFTRDTMHHLHFFSFFSFPIALLPYCPIYVNPRQSFETLNK